MMHLFQSRPLTVLYSSEYLLIEKDYQLFQIQPNKYKTIRLESLQIEKH